MKSLFYKLSTQTFVTFVTLLLVFAPFVSLTAQAQSVFDSGATPIANTNNPLLGATTGTTNSNGTIDTPISNQTAASQSVGTVNPAAGSAGAGAQQVSNQTPPTTPPGMFDSCKIIGFSPTGCISAVIYAFTIGIASVFAYVAAYFFDITIQLSLNGASYGLDFVSTSWTTARDLGNMAFLFILLYIAFLIIFRAETGETKTMLAMVIIVALLVNFSFFFTRIVIDAGNILSIQFYNAIPAPPISQTIQGSTGTAAAAVAQVSTKIGGTAPGTKDLTANLMNMLNVQGLLNNNSFSATNNNFIATILIYIAGAIVLWLLTIAFVTNGIKFLTRVVVLWFLIIASPLALIAIAVQGTGGYFKQWREMLLQHAFYPVAFMFVFLVLNNFATTMATSNALTGGVFATTQTTGASSFGAIGASLVALAIRLALVITVLYIGMKASDRISVKGSQAAGKAGGWVGGKFLGTYGGMYGALGRNTLGWAAYRASQNESFQNAAAKNSFARGLWRGTNSIAKSSFDVRAPLKAAGVKDIAGVSMGNANKGGYKGSFDAKVKRTEAEAKEFSTLTDAQKEAAKAAVESKYANEKATVTNQIVSVTAQKDAAELLQKEAQNKFDAAEKKLKEEERNVKDNQDKGVTDKTILEEAVNKRRLAQTERDSHEVELKKRTSVTQGFSNKIQDFNDSKKAIDEKIKKETKEEEKAVTFKNVYADSISKSGWGNISRAGLYIPMADKKAAEKIRKEKSSKDKIADAVKDLEKEENAGKEEKKEEPATDKKEDKKDDHH